MNTSGSCILVSFVTCLFVCLFIFMFSWPVVQTSQSQSCMPHKVVCHDCMQCMGMYEMNGNARVVYGNHKRMYGHCMGTGGTCMGMPVQCMGTTERMYGNVWAVYGNR